MRGSTVASLRVALAALVALGAAWLSLARAEEPPALRPTPFLRGACLTLHDEDPDRDYSPEVAEIASRLSASHVAVLVNLYQARADSPVPARGERTPSDEALAKVFAAARAHALGVALVPIVLLEEPGPEDWRARLRPPDVEAWFAGYEKVLLEYARLARKERAAVFCVGSELGWSHAHATRWRDLIAKVRNVFDGPVTYAANWDDYDKVSFWDALDFVSLSAYHELAREPGASTESLRKAWDGVRERLLAWRARAVPAKPLVFTELGYPSQKGCATRPWNYLASGEPDLDEQRRCFEAFFASWAGAPELQGVFVYEWWGEGGEDDTQYTPRGKPAESVIRRFFGDVKVVEARRGR